MSLRHLILLASLLLPAVPALSVAQTQPATTPALTVPPAPVQMASGSMLQTFAGLLLVLIVIFVIAWLFKRYAIHTGNIPGAIKVIAATAVGQRERVVLVEINDTWLVLGVAPGNISALHSMQKNSLQTSADYHDGQSGMAPDGKSTHVFQSWLQQVMERKTGKTP